MKPSFNLAETGSSFSPGRISITGGYQGDCHPVWSEYIATCPVDYRKYLIALRGVVIGDDFLYQNTATVISLGRGLVFRVEVEGFSVEISFTFRGWGDFMAAVAENCESYVTYY